uniref:Placenta associated 9 n=1 Tax=Vombatus ursinus TaxID=29139 RepID=A0A4X2LCM6_VOMUR
LSKCLRLDLNLTLDKTVEHLESEVKSLLNLMDGIAWNLPPEPGSPAENFFGDGACPSEGPECPGSSLDFQFLSQAPLQLQFNESQGSRGKK